MTKRNTYSPRKSTRRCGCSTTTGSRSPRSPQRASWSKPRRCSGFAISEGWDVIGYPATEPEDDEEEEDEHPHTIVIQAETGVLRV